MRVKDITKNTSSVFHVSMDKRSVQGSGRIVQCFVNADLRAGHHGLSILAHKAGIKVKDLEPGQYVVFINRARDKLKVYTANNIVAYMKSDTGRLEMRAIPLIPQAFRSDGTLHWDDALRKVLEELLAKKRK